MAKGGLNLSPLFLGVYLHTDDKHNNSLLDSISIAYKEVELNAC